MGWSNERVTRKFYQQTLPLYAREFLKINGKVWLPNVSDVETQVVCEAEIIKYFSIKYVHDPMENPLYRCTQDVTVELLKCPDKLVNENQIPKTGKPFILLERRERCLSDDGVNEIFNSQSTAKRKLIDPLHSFKSKKGK